MIFYAYMPHPLRLRSGQALNPARLVPRSFLVHHKTFCKISFCDNFYKFCSQNLGKVAEMLFCKRSIALATWKRRGISGRDLKMIQNYLSKLPDSLSTGVSGATRLFEFNKSVSATTSARTTFFPDIPGQICL